MVGLLWLKELKMAARGAPQRDWSVQLGWEVLALPGLSLRVEWSHQLHPFVWGWREGGKAYAILILSEVANYFLWFYFGGGMSKNDMPYTFSFYYLKKLG